MTDPRKSIIKRKKEKCPMWDSNPEFSARKEAHNLLSQQALGEKATHYLTQSTIYGRPA